MSEILLPSAETALSSLRKNGDQFATSPLVPQRLGRTTYLHPRDGVRPVEADPRVLRAIGHTYTNSKELRRAIMVVGGETNKPVPLLTSLEATYRGPRLVWSVSGFASIGHPCLAQANLLEALYRYLAIGYNRPALVCDGAAGAGVLGINGVLAAQHGIPTLGVTPLQGMSTMAPRKHMLVYGDTYQDREIIIGLLADILVVCGGGDGTLREAIATLLSGGYVLALGEPDESIAAWRGVPEIDKALNDKDKRMFICPSISEIAAFAEHVSKLAKTTMDAFRPQKLEHVKGLLAP